MILASRASSPADSEGCVGGRGRVRGTTKDDESDGNEAVARRFAGMDNSRVDNSRDDEHDSGSAASAGGVRVTRARAGGAAAASGGGTRVFKCYLEPWQKGTVYKESVANERALLAKCGDVQFIDKDSENWPMHLIYTGHLELSREVNQPQYMGCLPRRRTTTTTTRST